MFESIGFIGSGRITRAMLGGWRKADALPLAILPFDSSPAAVTALQVDFRL